VNTFTIAEATMVATLPHSRIGFDSPPKVKPELPKTARERGQLWSDAVFEAVMTLQKQLSSNSEAIAAAAANSILDLERTRIRHDKTVAGSCLPEAKVEAVDTSKPVADRQPLADLGPLPDFKPLPDRPPIRDLDAFASDPFDDEPLTDEECLESHMDEVMERIPKFEGKPITGAIAKTIVLSFLKSLEMKPSDIEPGEFMVHFVKKMRAEQAAGRFPAPAGKAQVVS
jgi:hypothetical protein